VHPEVEWQIQISAIRKNDVRAVQVERAVAHVRQLSTEGRIELRADVLDADTYASVLRQSTIVLIPYRGLHYHSCTSGVFAEAAAHGVLPIVAAESWAGKELQRLGLGELTFEEGSESSLTEVVERVLNDLAVLRGRMSRAAESWRAYHNPFTYVDIFSDAIVRSSQR